MRRWHRLTILGLAVCGLGAGATLAVASRSGPEPVAEAPLPTHPFSFSAKGATSAAPSAGTPTASAAVGAGCHAGPITGARVAVPSLGITAPLLPETIADRQLGIPSDVHDVGWWTGGGQLDGSTGTVLLAGHVDWVGQGDGALYPLAQIAPHATVCVTTGTGTVSAWSVVSADGFTKATLPQSIFTSTGPRQLVLVTCGGPFDATTGHYLDNVVVTAVPATSGTA